MLIYEPNPDEFENIDDECSGNPNHLGCFQVTPCHIGQPENINEVDHVNRSVSVSPLEFMRCYQA
jgi:hypothetical protein